jgi:hypothetical protein
VDRVVTIHPARRYSSLPGGAVDLTSLQLRSEKNQLGGYPGLDAITGLIDPSHVPPSGGFVAGDRPIVQFTPLSARVRNTNQGYNGGQNYVAARGYEYASWTRSDGHPVIAQRSHRRGGWSTPTDLSGILGTQVADGHNYTSLGVDGNGFVHVSGNMHAVPLKYCRSNSADSIASFSAQTMADGNIDHVTYPTFTPLPNGDLLFFYRNGFSGDGNSYLKRYSVSSGTWAQVAMVIDGVSEGQSAYTGLLVPSQDGSKLGLSGNWRVSGSPVSNADVWFIQSADGGVTWTDVNGTAVALPMTHATSPLAYPHAQNTGLLNTANLDWDSSGHPHLAFLDYDASGKSNVRHVWWNGSAWLNEFVTFGTYQMSLSPPPLPDGSIIVDGTVSRAGIVCTTAGATYVIWRTVKDGKRGTVRAIDVTIPGSPVEFTILNIDVGYQEFLWFDIGAVRAGRMGMLVTPQPFALAGGGDYGDALNWGAQWGATVSFDVNKLRELYGPMGGRPQFRITQAESMDTGVTATAATTTPVDVTGLPAAVIPQEFADSKRLALVKLTAQIAKATAGTGTWSVVQRDAAGGTLIRLASVSVAVASGTIMIETPWVPIQLDSLPLGGTLGLQGVSSDTNVTTMSAATLQVALAVDASGELATG